MSSFTRPLTVTKLKTGQWEVGRSFHYYLDQEGGEEILVPDGFTTDFASVPRLFWIILPPDGRYTQAAVLHDYLYSVAGEIPGHIHDDGKIIHNIVYKRKDCDKIFIKAMRVLGVGWCKRVAMHRAVRAFGFIPWNRVHNSLQEQEGDKDT